MKPLRYEPDAMLSDPDSLRSWMARSAAGLKPKTKTPRQKLMESK